MLDPGGYFRGNTVHASWREVNDAQSYSVAIEQCNQESVCTQVQRTKSVKRTPIAIAKMKYGMLKMDAACH